MNAIVQTVLRTVSGAQRHKRKPLFNEPYEDAGRQNAVRPYDARVTQRPRLCAKKEKEEDEAATVIALFHRNSEVAKTAEPSTHHPACGGRKY